MFLELALERPGRRGAEMSAGESRGRSPPGRLGDRGGGVQGEKGRLPMVVTGASLVQWPGGASSMTFRGHGGRGLRGNRVLALLLVILPAGAIPSRAEGESAGETFAALR